MALPQCRVNVPIFILLISHTLSLMHFRLETLQRPQPTMSFVSLSKRPTSVDLLVATAVDLQRDLSSGNLTSVELVNACLDQIEQHDDHLNAIISKPPRVNLVVQAQKLDVERKMKRIRGKLHGIPVLIKVLPSLFLFGPLSDFCVQDNIATLPEFHMGTTAGNFALAGSKPKSNAVIIDRVMKLLYSPKRRNADSKPACRSRSDHHRQGESVSMMTSLHTQPISDLMAHSYP